MDNKVSDILALFLKEKKIKHIFGIIGSANAHIFDSITRLNYTKIVCVHHEQAATMAMQYYFRTSGKISAALVTAGAGSSNPITGVVAAWADSMPGIIISGQESTKNISNFKKMSTKKYYLLCQTKNKTKILKRSSTLRVFRAEIWLTVSRSIHIRMQEHIDLYQTRAFNFFLPSELAKKINSVYN